MVRSSRRFSRVMAAVCSVAVLLGATACNNDSSGMSAGIGQEPGPQLDTDGEPFIHANHNRGVDPKLTLGDINGEEDLDAYDKEILEWGLQQTPDWLEICNTINKHELRKLGVDPQKDLLQRQPGEGKRWVCGWKHDAKQLVLIAKHARSLDKVSQPPRFILDHVATVNGSQANVGQVEEKIPLEQACAVDYEYHGGVYTVLYHRARKHDNPTMACDTALKLAERQ